MIEWGKGDKRVKEKREYIHGKKKEQSALKSNSLSSKCNEKVPVGLEDFTCFHGVDFLKMSD